jgi:8-oxo-dGTP pyrophosphatase MutT (NUDIX family)
VRTRVPVPAQLAAAASAFLAEDREPVPARKASTVVLVRDGAAGIELYLLRRQTSMAFAAGMYVFPGGGVDPRDADTDIAWSGPPPAAWADRLGVAEALARGLVSAAVRETFEESGVLLAGQSSSSVVADVSSAEWEADRLALESREISLAQLLSRRKPGPAHRPAGSLGELDHPRVRAAALRHLVLRRCASCGSAHPRHLHRGGPGAVDGAGCGGGSRRLRRHGHAAAYVRHLHELAGAGSSTAALAAPGSVG